MAKVPPPPTGAQPLIGANGVALDMSRRMGRRSMSVLGDSIMKVRAQQPAAFGSRPPLAAGVARLLPAAQPR